MNIREALLQEHSLAQAKRIAAHACKHHTQFALLMDCFFSTDYTVSQRAAWAVSHAARSCAHCITPYLPGLVSQLLRTDVHDAIVRNALRILNEVALTPDLHDELMNACFVLVEKHTSPIAVKALALSLLQKLSRIYPEIKNELLLIIQDRWDNETPAFKSRARKILKEFERQP